MKPTYLQKQYKCTDIIIIQRLAVQCNLYIICMVLHIYNIIWVCGIIMGMYILICILFYGNGNDLEHQSHGAFVQIS